MADEIERRKREHLELAGGGDVASRGSSGWEDIHLLHEALPELDPAAVDPSVELLGRRLALPLCIAAMTGGHRQGGEVNGILARAAERAGIPMGVGSQRAALVEPGFRETYSVAREAAPGAFLIANIGVAQLVPQGDEPALEAAEVEALVEMIRADALAIHLNAVQELIQPEGQPNARGWLAGIERISARVSVPVIAKETGAGIAEGAARRLRDAGVRALDVGGLGGTSFAAIERARALAGSDERGQRLGDALVSWGIPTAVSIALASRSGLPVIGTGGVRSGIDAAKAIALGATAVGVARPFLQAALDGGDAAVAAWVEGFRQELVAALVLTGSATITALRSVPRVIVGATADWLGQLGPEPAASP